MQAFPRRAWERENQPSANVGCVLRTFYQVEISAVCGTHPTPTLAVINEHNI
ncbi:hypothetical protein THIOM_000913 [Candidatus Thiomargarita nelsonii]|uniref:Uncharacterized protein n=1 Tax=Candidatus Thiomargarita nelsonii TaxID=1003181 RepID=A0A176S5S7_9GAMM|nr:hypothetical protein THIOM_000913 [Candidatus Thiomargarita nelsonii]